MLQWPRAAEGKKTLTGVADRARFKTVRADDAGDTGLAPNDPVPVVRTSPMDRGLP
jgi:hypothetical protein